MKNGYSIIETITPQREILSQHRTREAAEKAIERKLRRQRKTRGMENTGVFAVVAEIVDGEVIAPSHVTSGLWA